MTRPVMHWCVMHGWTCEAIEHAGYDSAYGLGYADAGVAITLASEPLLGL